MIHWVGLGALIVVFLLWERRNDRKYINSYFGEKRKP